ncbi:hypothetical protein TVAG_459200 [Trichomonas vaginalis G3]|uniref:Uncharacterized protein n=1 Tax=Trichomonas vaginalis (strain ATCC PRA-98 / G3) TaxID=412133 RepID=A2E6C5_TRIV3|nr:hypothetical protein TVAGG3_0394870 [Trichomonas vaginalis G3]EAY11848.1 hypothetical protein TVAG_459200 [Trichomonas vaginalis G3]KAI5534265.1 hypothetical protein TVAGG3_0394870 [Trichomonas vaginalis G3]|eukprot:XP_001324071.1 hypothetical protein [Trichomonas vaginalis G3]
MISFLASLGASKLTCTHNETAPETVVRKNEKGTFDGVKCIKTNPKTLFFFNQIQDMNVEFCTTNSKSHKEECITSSTRNPIVSYFFDSYGTFKYQINGKNPNLGMHIVPVSICPSIQISTKQNYTFKPTKATCIIPGGIPKAQIIYESNITEQPYPIIKYEADMAETPLSMTYGQVKMSIDGFIKVEKNVTGVSLSVYGESTESPIVYAGDIKMVGATYAKDYVPEGGSHRGFYLGLIIFTAIAAIAAVTLLAVFFIRHQTTKYYTEIPQENEL